MLVLARKKDERIIIGDLVEVTVIQISGDRVKLGFRGPDTVRILRQELTTQSTGERLQTVEGALPYLPVGR